MHVCQLGILAVKHMCDVTQLTHVSSCVIIHLCHHTGIIMIMDMHALRSYYAVYPSTNAISTSMDFQYATPKTGLLNNN